MGNDSSLMRHEFFLYIFDAVLMFGVMVVFNVVHPSEVNALLKGGRMAKGWKMVDLKEDLEEGSSDGAILESGIRR